MFERQRHRRRGLVLPVMLLILLLLGLLAASFAFRVHADYSAMNAVAFGMHTRLAAEAGLQSAMLLLRTQQNNVAAWYNNPELLNRVIVWTPDDETVWGTNREFDENVVAYRFSLVADDPLDDLQRCRYGITDESAKLNINTATGPQLRRLIAQIATKDMVVDQLVDALLDWRDADDTVRESGAEAPYYAGLKTPYRPKNGPFDTVEELLLVRGFNGRVLYGEDFDRNGIFTPNEDDGDKSFPEDDSDGLLNRGMYPYVTAISRDSNLDAQNRPRIFLYGNADQVRSALSEFFDEAKVEFIMATVTGQSGNGQNSDDQGAGDQTGQDATPVEGDQARRSQVQPSDQDADDGQDQNETDPSQEPPGQGPSTGSGAGSGTATPRLNSPADLLTAPDPNPLTTDDLPILMANTTTQDPLRPQEGLINVLTAPPQVLRCLDGLDGNAIGGILSARAELDEEERADTAWLVTRGILSLEDYARVAPQLTVRGQQFTIEALGYADHIGTVSRLQVIVEMRGPVAQVIYYRDLTNLGAAFPIRRNEAELGFEGKRG
ncbi:MAG: general secretion pathway protein GspK [Phycisphaerae bacterium]